ncbi:hypothetical protein, partial [Planobispora takensis]
AAGKAATAAQPVAATAAALRPAAVSEATDKTTTSVVALPGGNSATPADGPAGTPAGFIVGGLLMALGAAYAGRGFLRERLSALRG